MNEQELGRLIADVAGEVYESVGGAGLEVRLYRDTLKYQLEQRGFTVEARRIPPGTYTGVKITRPENVDMVVNDAVIVECYAESKHDPRWEAQLLSHLRMTGLKLGLVINFGDKNMRSAVRRVLNAVG